MTSAAARASPGVPDTSARAPSSRESPSASAVGLALFPLYGMVGTDTDHLIRRTHMITLITTQRTGPAGMIVRVRCTPGTLAFLGLAR